MDCESCPFYTLTVKTRKEMQAVMDALAEDPPWYMEKKEE